MSAEILQFEAGCSEYFGRCPVCNRTASRMVNFGRDHWMVCLRDRTRWFIGENLFSGWREESEAQQRAVLSRFSSFRVVDPTMSRA